MEAMLWRPDVFYFHLKFGDGGARGGRFAYGNFLEEDGR